VETSSLDSLEEKRPRLLTISSQRRSRSTPFRTPSCPARQQTHHVSARPIPWVTGKAGGEEIRNRTWSSEELEAREWSRDALSKRAGSGRSSSSAATAAASRRICDCILFPTSSTSTILDGRGLCVSLPERNSSGQGGAESRGREKEQERGVRSIGEQRMDGELQHNFSYGTWSHISIFCYLQYKIKKLFGFSSYKLILYIN
jgi:hypothetical protein